MSATEDLNVGIVGAVGRGRSFAEALRANGARIHAVCDIQEDKLEECARKLGADESYTDYDDMLTRSDLDAVVVGTPMPLHVPQSIKALEEGLHVLSEVPAGVSVEECKELVLACRRSDALYMMAENYAYIRPNVFVRELVRAGLFGEVYYAEGEYLHELKELNEITRWRRKWQTGIDGITYPTHSLGPILQWMPGDRVVRVCCEGSGRHYTDPRGESYHQESPVMLCKTARDALINIRVDMISDRPHCMNVYQLQGTDGVYESSRGGPGDRHKIWLRELSDDIRWFELDEVIAEDNLGGRYMPDSWLNPPEEALRAGHGGGDYFEIADFVASIRGEIECPIGIHEAMDMTLPGLISQQSIQRDGRWLPVPDSREWTEEPPYSQLHMVWSEERLDSPPEPEVPSGYELRQYRAEDRQQYLDLMHRAGFGDFDEERLDRMLRSVLPDGFFVVEHKGSGRVVATAMAVHSPKELHPHGGELGWVAGDPDHSGKHLGMAVCAAVVRRFIRAGYRRIYLQTDDHRLPAVKTYLRLGFEPLYYRDDMEDRWSAVCEQLGWELQ
ncbi:MAG: GNAT family N-acetyltransferase [Candidatus Brocadiia bacterium]